MPAYKYTLKRGKTTRWRAKFYVTDWTVAKSRYANVVSKPSVTQKSLSTHSWISRTRPDILFHEICPG